MQQVIQRKVLKQYRNAIVFHVRGFAPALTDPCKFQCMRRPISFLVGKEAKSGSQDLLWAEFEKEDSQVYLIPESCT